MKASRERAEDVADMLGLAKTSIGADVIASAIDAAVAEAVANRDALIDRLTARLRKLQVWCTKRVGYDLYSRQCIICGGQSKDESTPVQHKPECVFCGWLL